MRQQYEPRFDVEPRHPGLDALEDGFCMVDRGWRITYWNPAAQRLTGLAAAGMLGSTLWERLPAWRDGESWTQLQAVRDEGTPRRYLEGPPGGRPISIHAAPLGRDALALHFRDATEEVRRAEQYARLLESLRDGFLAVDAAWTIVYINSVAESLLRVPRARALGTSLWALLPRGVSEVADCLRATMHDGAERHLREVRPGRRVLRGRVFDLWTFPLAGGGLSILFEDVSERVQHERELARLAAEAQEANEAKSRFFAAISHELRTPLNAIVGYTHLLGSATYGALPTGAHRAAERASLCAEHLSRLVDDVLLLTTSEMGRLQVQLEQVDLASHLASILEPLVQQAEAKGLHFELEVPEGLSVETDPQRLRQLLVALIGNAVRFTSRGRVSLVVSVVSEGAALEGEEEAYSLFPEPHVEFLVRDTGPGVPPEHRERIFGPFEQLGDPARSDSMSRGTGLGLTVARKLARLLRGSLELTDTSSAGSTFRARLPVRHPRGASHQES